MPSRTARLNPGPLGVAWRIGECATPSAPARAALRHHSSARNEHASLSPRGGRHCPSVHWSFSLRARRHGTQGAQTSHTCLLRHGHLPGGRAEQEACLGVTFYMDFRISARLASYSSFVTKPLSKRSFSFLSLSSADSVEAGALAGAVAFSISASFA